MAGSEETLGQATPELAERTVTEQAGSAFRAAFEATLRSGQSVVIAEEQSLYRIYPDGTRERIGKVDGPVLVSPGTRKIKWKRAFPG